MRILKRPQLSIKNADAGDINSQVAVGWAYYTGVGLAQDKQLGLDYLHRAEKAGSERAAFRLAFFREVEGDPSCIAMFEKLAARRYGPAVYELGNIYRDGLIVPRNMNKAAAYWCDSGSCGHRLGEAKAVSMFLRDPNISFARRSVLRAGLIVKQIQCFFGLVLIPTSDSYLGRG